MCRLGQALIIAVLLLSPLQAPAQGVEDNPTGVDDLAPDRSESSDTSEPAWLGILMDKTEAGVQVRTVLHESPAARAGIRTGDVIRSLDETRLESPDQLRDVVRAGQPGAAISVELRRDGETQTISVELSAAPGLADILDKHFVGRPAPALTWTPITRPDEQESLSAIERPVVVEFWATWCTPCKPMRDYLGKLSGEVKGKVEFVALSGEEIGRLRAAGARENAAGSAYIPIGKVGESVLTDWIVEAYPTVFVIDRRGRVAGAFTGLESRPAIGRLVQKLAKTSKESSTNE